MANVSFYLIAILSLHVKCHSLQERNVQGNVLTVDHHVKKKYMYIYYSPIMSFDHIRSKYKAVIHRSVLV